MEEHTKELRPTGPTSDVPVCVVTGGGPSGLGGSGCCCDDDDEGANPGGRGGGPGGLGGAAPWLYKR